MSSPLPRHPIMPPQVPQGSQSDLLSADVDQATSQPIDQHAFCKALYDRAERDNVVSLNRARSKQGNLWCVGGLFAVCALMLLGTIWMLDDDNDVTPPPREYHAIADEFNNTESRANDTRKLSGRRERQPETPESWMNRHVSVVKKCVAYNQAFLPSLEGETLAANVTKSRNGNANSFCNTVECQRTAAFLEQQLDPTFGPCESLYDHVCSRWRVKHAKSTRRRGRYSVDDAILESYRRTLARRLAVDDKTRPFREMRSFFLQCTRNQLTSRYEIDEIKGLLELGSSPSVVSLATTIVRLARIGFSPFFDVSVTGHPEKFRVKLFKPAVTLGPPEGPANDWFVSGESSNKLPASKMWRIVAANSSNTSDMERTLFMRLLGRIICAEIVRSVPGANKKCSLDEESAMSPAWNYGWYKSTGVEMLTVAVDRELGSLVLEESTTTVATIYEDGAGSQSVIDSTSHRRWKAAKDLRDACLNVMSKHDPYLLSYWSSITAKASQLAERAKASLRQLTKVVGRRFASFDNFSMSYGLPTALDNFTVLSTHQADVYGDELEGSRLLRFLSNSTWKLWLGITRRRTAFSTAAAISETAPSVVEVPEPVFNLTALKDPWLRLLEVARYAPRILGAVLRRSNITEELMSSPFGKCASKYFSTPDEGDSSVDSFRRAEAYLGALELAAFHTALGVYRSDVGRSVESVPGTDMNGESFFLFYYVFNECEVFSARRDARNAYVPMDIAESTTRLKFFPKMSNLLAKILLPGCKASGIQLAGCGFQSATVGTAEHNGIENATAIYSQ